MSSKPPDPLALEELAVKKQELHVRRLEAEKASATSKLPWWRRADPLLLAVIAGVLTLLGNTVVAILNDVSSAKQEQKKATDDLKLEQAKARYNLVLQAMATNDATVAKRNIHFFIDAGLLEDSDCSIRDAIDKDQPVLPALSGIVPSMPAGTHSAPEIAILYNFPRDLDGRGQTIGILEYGGSIVQSDINQYFKSLNLPPPDVTSVAVDGAHYDSDGVEDGQVMLDVEVAGAIAPRARIRVYFLPQTAAGFTHALEQAQADGVTVISDGWGLPEGEYKDEARDAMNQALKAAGERGITVLAAVGDRGAAAGANGGGGVVFPASSPWVLAVGGTVLKAANGRIVSEVPWAEANALWGTQAGVSDKIPLPSWQSAIATSSGVKSGTGRRIPDVVASADPSGGIGIVVHGSVQVIGGTSASVPVWAGLIALINQGLGYRVGYFNPQLYQEIGPAKVLRPIVPAANVAPGTSGHSTVPGWTAATGWGSPNGTQLLEWFRAHPMPNRAAGSIDVGCKVKPPAAGATTR